MDAKGKLGQKNKNLHITYGLLLLFSVLTMLAATKSSPIYSFNDWVDANAFFTMGKAMFNGKVLYRDVFDHKGPILHFLHGLAWLVSHNSFLGIWLLEIVACYFTLLFCYRILTLYTDKRSILIIPVFAVIVYSTGAMLHGDSAEELCLPFLMYAVWLAIRSLKEKEDIPCKSLFMLGITSGFIFWIKYTLLGFYLGWVILPLFLAIRDKKWKYILHIVLFIGAGVLAVTAAVLPYFLINGAMHDLWEVYFYTNIFKYSIKLKYIYESLMHAVKVFGYYGLMNWTVLLLISVGGLWALVKRKFMLLIQILLMLLGGATLIYGKSVPLFYYFMIFCGFSIFGLIPLYTLISKKVSQWNPKFYAGVLLVISALLLPATLLCSPSRDMLQYKKADLPQYQFAQMINQKENATLLNYGFMDSGFYTVTGIVPSNRYFCIMNVDKTEAREEQDNIVRNGMVDFVITRDEKLDSALYEEKMVSEFIYEDVMYEYTLYERKAN